MQGNLQLQSSAKHFDIAFTITKSSFCGALLKRILGSVWGISKGSTWNEIVPLSVIFPLPYSKYRNVKTGIRVVN